jgi:hypothetical protein
MESWWWWRWLAAGGFHLSTNAINTVGVISCKKGRRYFRISATQSPPKNSKFVAIFLKKKVVWSGPFFYSPNFLFSFFISGCARIVEGGGKVWTRGRLESKHGGGRFIYVTTSSRGPTVFLSGRFFFSENKKKKNLVANRRRFSSVPRLHFLSIE